MSKRKPITEEMKEHGKWYKEADQITMDTLPDFLKKLTEKYEHDYGTICHALTAGAIATANAINRSPVGGITGFQAGAVMWEFIRQWNFKNNKTGLALIDYDNLLYPQYEYKFNKHISSCTWNALQKEAQRKMDEAFDDYKKYLVDLKKYEKEIKIFVGKYPDYYENREYYDPLKIGTSDDWEKEYKKRDSGFEFAPQKPYEPIDEKSSVYIHWEEIVNGKVPFGYTVVND